MKDDFFEWLNECPTEWVLNGDDEDGRTYFFRDNGEDGEEKLSEEG